MISKLRAALALVDRRDVLCFGGLGVFIWGGLALSPAWTRVVVGLFCVALAAPWRRPDA